MQLTRDDGRVAIGLYEAERLRQHTERPEEVEQQAGCWLGDVSLAEPAFAPPTLHEAAS